MYLNNRKMNQSTSRSQKQKKTPEQLLASLQERQATEIESARNYRRVAAAAFLAMVGTVLAAVCGYPLGLGLFSTALGQALFTVLLADIAGVVGVFYMCKVVKLNRSIASRALHIDRLTP